MRHTFDYCFYCRKSKANKKGLAHIELSVSINGTRKYITLPYSCKPDDFNKVRKPKPIQEYISLITANINQYIIDLTRADMEINIPNLSYAIINGSINKIYKVTDLFSEYNSIIEKRDITFGQYKKYISTNRLFLDIIGDKTLTDITNSDILIFETALYKKYKPNTAAGHMVRIKTYFKYAQDNNKTKINPTSNIRVKRSETRDIVYLTDEEYSALKIKDMHTERLNKVRDLWVFQASTGLSYCDMANLSPEDIKTSPEGFKYITKERQKTGVKYTSVLLPDAIDILQKYNYNLPLLSNQRYNSYIQECIAIAGIEKHISTHCARHQYATRLLASGIPITTIQHCLGHSSVLVTEKYYAALSDKTIISQISNTPSLINTPIKS